MKHIRWGFIGCGEVVERKSGPAFNEIAGSQVVAVMSRTAERASSYAERHGIKRWYTDAQQLVDDPDVNAVYVATPPSSHATFAIMAMRAGKPVYVEKPLASTYEDCVRVNRVSEETGVPCFVAYYRRYLPYFRQVKQLIEDGRIGQVASVQVRFTTPPREMDAMRGAAQPWRLNPTIAGGGYFYDLAAHQLDLLQDFFGIIVRAHGYCTNRAGLYEAEDTVSASFRFENGLVGSGSWCFVGPDSPRDEQWRGSFRSSQPEIRSGTADSQRGGSASGLWRMSVYECERNAGELADGQNLGEILKPPPVLPQKGEGKGSEGGVKGE